MTVTHSFSFETEEEAYAFIRGIEYVNDSAISVGEPYFCKDKLAYPYIVDLVDQDGKKVEDDEEAS